MSRSLIIPDIHLKTAVADVIIKRRESEVDGTVLLGDIFHDFGDDCHSNGEAAAWLRHKIEDPKMIVLVGNHDAGHYWPKIVSLTNCPGWTGLKHRTIRAYLSEQHIAKTFLAFWVDGWLLSHAGINPYFAKTVQQVSDVIANCEDDIKAGRFHGLLKWGSRMDTRPIHPGGILWQDWDEEFRPIPNINQIVGHTPGRSVREEITPNSANICLDTGLNHYAIIDDGVVTIYDITHTAVQEIRQPVVAAEWPSGLGAGL